MSSFLVLRVFFFFFPKVWLWTGLCSWKCKRPGHLAQDCLVTTSNQVHYSFLIRFMIYVQLTRGAIIGFSNEWKGRQRDGIFYSSLCFVQMTLGQSKSNSIPADLLALYRRFRNLSIWLSYFAFHFLSFGILNHLML